MGPPQIGRATERVPSGTTGQRLPALVNGTRRLLNAASARATFGSPEIFFGAGAGLDGGFLALRPLLDVAVTRDPR